MALIEVDCPGIKATAKNIRGHLVTRHWYPDSGGGFGRRLSLRVGPTHPLACVRPLGWFGWLLLVAVGCC